MDAFYERLSTRAATIDELLSEDFEPLPGQKADADLTARRLAAWSQASTAGDPDLFGQRLARDRLTIDQVRARFGAVQRKGTAPTWLDDAVWIEGALQESRSDIKRASRAAGAEPTAFEHLFVPLLERAEAMIERNVGARVLVHLTEPARASLRLSLLKTLSGFCAPALYERFTEARNRDAKTGLYERFVAAMKAGGWRSLFEQKPVLLRLIATLTRQWIDTTSEFLLRLDADLAAVRDALLPPGAAGQVTAIEGGLSDPHNDGRTVQLVTFEDGARIVYKPKDLRLDAAWHALVARLNAASPPHDLKAAKVIARDGYGWTDFIDHVGCADTQGYNRFFQRAGAWLALFHCFAATDIHQENMIAAGEHPVPIDLEMVLQATAEEDKARDAESQAVDAAMEMVASSVMAVGMLPAFARSPDNNVFAFGAMTADWTTKIRVKWNAVNSDDMRPVKSTEIGTDIPNLPHVGGHYAKFAEHTADFIAGFESYAAFLQRQAKNNEDIVFGGFSGLPVRKVIRPTKFYDMLLQRLKSHRSMDDGAAWSAQADFVARLADWDSTSDLIWPLHRAERAALLALNVPHFVSASDADEISDASGLSARTGAVPGLARARARLRAFDKEDLDWQVTVIQQNLNAIARADAHPHEKNRQAQTLRGTKPTPEVFAAEAGKIADELARYAVRRGPGAAWIGLDWLGDADVFQLACLGTDLYNGTSGIALFLAGHASVTGSGPSATLARAALSHVRKILKSRNAARTARALGVGGATGLGSIVYALTVIARFLRDDAILADAQIASALITDELIAADKYLDVMGGSAGAILGLLRLYRDTQSADVLARATQCGEHLLRQPRNGPEGRRCWSGAGLAAHTLNGMSHGAAGYAYALAALAAAAGRDDFAQAAAECVAFEDASYNSAHSNWPDLREEGEPAWPCQWCHGAPGIGLARIAMSRRGTASEQIGADIRNALAGTERGWPGVVDTLCCGALGSVEFFCEAADTLDRKDLHETAARRLLDVIEAASSTGDFRWNNGNRRFNLGLFRGLAGVGYTLLRRADETLPNVLIWE